MFHTPSINQVKKQAKVMNIPILISKTLFSSLLNLIDAKQENITLKFYEFGYEFQQGEYKIIYPRNRRVEDDFRTNISSLNYKLPPDSPSFTVSKSLIDNVCSDMSYIIKESNFKATLDLKKGKLVISNLEDIIEVPCDFKSDPCLTLKKINIVRLQKLLGGCSEEVKISTSDNPEAFLYFENDLEYIVMSVVRK